jgi:hypothetical protein
LLPYNCKKAFGDQNALAYLLSTSVIEKKALPLTAGVRQAHKNFFSLSLMLLANKLERPLSKKPLLGYVHTLLNIRLSLRGLLEETL